MRKFSLAELMLASLILPPIAYGVRLVIDLSARGHSAAEIGWWLFLSLAFGVCAAAVLVAGYKLAS